MVFILVAMCPQVTRERVLWTTDLSKAAYDACLLCGLGSHSTEALVFPKPLGTEAWLCYAGPPCKLSPGIFHFDNFESLHLNSHVG